MSETENSVEVTVILNVSLNRPLEVFLVTVDGTATGMCQTRTICTCICHTYFVGAYICVYRRVRIKRLLTSYPALHIKRV